MDRIIISLASIVVGATIAIFSIYYSGVYVSISQYVETVRTLEDMRVAVCAEHYLNAPQSDRNKFMVAYPSQQAYVRSNARWNELRPELEMGGDFGDEVLRKCVGLINKLARQPRILSR